MLRHNLPVGTPNHTGKKYSGHFDIWLYNHLQKIAEKTCDLIPDSQVIQVELTYGTIYVPTKKVFGILPVPDNICAKTAMQPYISGNTEKKQAPLSGIQTRNMICCDEYAHYRREADIWKADARKSSFQLE